MRCIEILLRPPFSLFHRGGTEIQRNQADRTGQKHQKSKQLGYEIVVKYLRFELACILIPVTPGLPDSVASVTKEGGGPTGPRSQGKQSITKGSTETIAMVAWQSITKGSSSIHQPKAPRQSITKGSTTIHHKGAPGALENTSFWEGIVRKRKRRCARTAPCAFLQCHLKKKGAPSPPPKAQRAQQAIPRKAGCGKAKLG